MSRRPLGRSFTGSGAAFSSFWHEDGEGNWAVESSQDCSGLVDLNKEASNHCNPYNAARDVRMVARIPLVVITMWRNKYGIDYWSRDPDVQRRIDRLLDDPEWQWLRTDLGNNPSVMLSAPVVDETPRLIVPEPANVPRETVTLESA